MRGYRKYRYVVQAQDEMRTIFLQLPKDLIAPLTLKVFDSQEQEVMYFLGQSIAEIAKMYGLSRTTARKYLLNYEKRR